MRNGGLPSTRKHPVTGLDVAADILRVNCPMQAMVLQIEFPHVLAKVVAYIRQLDGCSV